MTSKFSVSSAIWEMNVSESVAETGMAETDGWKKWLCKLGGKVIYSGGWSDLQEKPIKTQVTNIDLQEKLLKTGNK